MLRLIPQAPKAVSKFISSIRGPKQQHGMATSASLPGAPASGSTAEETGPSTKPPSIVGNAGSSFWLFDSTNGFDLTHPSKPEGPIVKPRFQLNTTTMPVIIAPEKTALIVIDMQNFFLSAAMGAKRGQGHEAEDKLLSHVLPAARKAKIQIIHVTWGISDEELAVLPPVIFRIFGYDEAKDNRDDFSVRPPSSPMGLDKEVKCSEGVGDDLGDVKLPDGTVVPAGRMLMRDQLNTGLHGPLQANYDDSQSGPMPDVRFHKCRLSGFWGGSTSCLEYLKEKNITTLLFSGVNTDQCVLAFLQDACNMGYDTILLKDACGTDSPAYTTKMVEYNCRKSWGFVSDSQALVDGVDSIQAAAAVDP
ncbi:Isochorismatase-like protein [Rhypophila decipiens]